MPQPNNYSLNVPQPDLVGSLSAGMQIRDRLDARDEKARQLKLQNQMLSDLSLLGTSPTVSNINVVMAKYPAMADKFKPMLESANAQQKQSKIGQASDVYASLLAGRHDIAQKILQEQADAARNGGDEQGAKSAELMKQLIVEGGDHGAKTVLGSAGMFLSTAMGGDKFAETFGKLETSRREAEKAPAELTKLQAEADKAAVAAKFAESQAVSDLQKSGWDIKAIQNDMDVKRQNVRIAAMNAATARETNAIKRKEMQVQLEKAITERDEKVRAKATEVSAVRDDVDNMLGTIEMALSTPESTIRNSVGPLAGRIPAVSQEESDFRESIDTLQSQTMLQQLKNLKAMGTTMGALNEKEGEALRKSFVNLSLKQSPDRLIANLKEAKRLLGKTRDLIAKKYGVPDNDPDIRPGSGQKIVVVE